MLYAVSFKGVLNHPLYLVKKHNLWKADTAMNNLVNSSRCVWKGEFTGAV